MLQQYFPSKEGTAIYYSNGGNYRIFFLQRLLICKMKFFLWKPRTTKWSKFLKSVLATEAINFYLKCCHWNPIWSLKYWTIILRFVFHCWIEKTEVTCTGDVKIRKFYIKIVQSKYLFPFKASGIQTIF